MRVGYIQYNVKRNLDENFKIIKYYLNKMDCDIVVLPELCLCGYLFESKEELMSVAETAPTSITVNKMKELSQEHNCAIIFGMAEVEGEKIFNTAVCVAKGVYVGKYRKIHLSDFEKKWFDRGNSNEVFDIFGIKIGIQICFDLWFPEISREQVRKGANLLCVLANFGGETSYSIAQIRAIENLTPLVLCNRIGNEQLPNMNAQFLGKSTVFDSTGTRIIGGDSGIETAISCEIEISNDMSNVICDNFILEIERHYTK